MRTLRNYIALLTILLVAASCEKDDDKIIVSGHNASQLTTTASDVVLSGENNNSIVLSLVWDNSQLSLSNQSMSVPTGIPIVTLQSSATSNFAIVTESKTTANSQAFIGSELNTLAKNAGLKAGTAAPLYFRIKSLLGNNLEPVYSNASTVNVTPFQIDMSLLFVLNKDKTDTIANLYSATSNGEYGGFMAASAWMNLYFLEGDAKLWGNDGVSGTAFKTSSDAATLWNGWFPGNNGCYFVTLSTASSEWTATYLPEITVGGDVSATLTFSVAQKIWSGEITTTANNANITLSSAAKRYNILTGTTDASAVATPIGFVESQAGVLVKSDVAGNITVPTAGVYTLTLDLNNPTHLTYTLTAGAITPVEPEVPNLYLAGIDDGVSGSWTFDNFIPKLADGTYAGVVYANSKYGYKMYTTAAWADFYSKDAADGTLVKNGADNIPVPETATYLIKADLTKLTYSMLKLGDVIYLSGLNNAWDFNTTLAKTGNGVYSGTIVVTTKSDWGFKIYLENGNWDEVFGGSAGAVYYKGNGITDDAPGTYTLTVDLIHNTYQMVLN